MSDFDRIKVLLMKGKLGLKNYCLYNNRHCCLHNCNRNDNFHIQRIWWYVFSTGLVAHHSSPPAKK